MTTKNRALSKESFALAMKELGKAEDLSLSESSFAKTFLSRHGVSFLQEGTAAIYSPESLMLIVRHNAAGQKKVDELLKDYLISGEEQKALLAKERGDISWLSAKVEPGQIKGTLTEVVAQLNKGLGKECILMGENVPESKRTKSVQVDVTKDMVVGEVLNDACGQAGMIMKRSRSDIRLRLPTSKDALFKPVSYNFKNASLEEVVKEANQILKKVMTDYGVESKVPILQIAEDKATRELISGSKITVSVDGGSIAELGGLITQYSIEGLSFEITEEGIGEFRCVPKSGD